MRRLAYELGYCYRLHRADLPGTPDLCFARPQKVIFVHGCFWHQHHCKLGNKRPQTNQNYWLPKLERNVARDEIAQEKLRELGWDGRRAQAIVAGLLDVFAGTERVESGRINDPSRHYPGDVCIRSTSDPQVWEKAFEVRDKPVSASDVQIFGKKCIDVGVREAAVVMVNEGQQALDRAALEAWAASFGIGLTLFHGWEAFIEQVLFWSEKPQPIAANLATERIHARLVAVEASEEAVQLWAKLISAK